MQAFKWALKSAKGNYLLYGVGIVLVLICNILLLMNPYFLKQLVDKVIAPPQGVTRDVSLLVPLIITCLSIIVGRLILYYIMTVLFEKVSLRVAYNIRRDMYTNLQKQDSGFFDTTKTGDIMTRFTSDLEMVRHAINWSFRIGLETILMFIGSILFLLTVNWILALMLAVTCTPAFFLMKTYFKKSGPKHAAVRESLTKLNSNAQENIAANRVVRAFAREDYEISQFDEKSQDFKAANIDSSFLWFKYFPGMDISAYAMDAITLGVGGIFVIKGWMTLGDYLLFSSLLWTLSSPMRYIGIILNDIQRFFVSGEKVMALYYREANIQTPDQPKNNGPVEGEISFQNVCLDFDGKRVLHNINLDIKKGETICITGSTGAGKTLLIDLISRIYDPTSGAVLVDGVKTRDWDLAELRRGIGVANQKVFLFSDTVDGNIAYGVPEMSEEEVKRFTDMAAGDFVYKLSDGFDTIIGERGIGLSGGQRQRLALARALAFDPKILILDDTTSALDFETESYIREQLNSIKATKIIITHRILTAKNADKILVMDGGKIVEQGSHSQLIKNRGYYYDICVLQGEVL